MKDDYVGDLIVNNLLIDIFRDDKLCKNRIKLEITDYQKTKISINLIYLYILDMNSLITRGLEQNKKRKLKK